MAYSLDDLRYLMQRLRDPEAGCPWDLKQTFASIVPHTLEESYELADAIEHNDIVQIRQELGDVLFQVIFYNQLAEEQQAFTFEDIVTELVEKLLRRHPHVFPDGQLDGSRGAGPEVVQEAEVNNSWELIKQQERSDKAQHGLLDDIPKALPALTRAKKLQKRASQVGFDWAEHTAVLEKLKEELEELTEAWENGDSDAIHAEVGDLLFTCVNLARHLNVDSETALRHANSKFEQRFRYMEDCLEKGGSSPHSASNDTMNRLWEQAKAEIG